MVAIHTWTGKHHSKRSQAKRKIRLSCVLTVDVGNESSMSLREAISKNFELNDEMVVEKRMR